VNDAEGTGYKRLMTLLIAVRDACLEILRASLYTMGRGGSKARPGTITPASFEWVVEIQMRTRRPVGGIQEGHLPQGRSRS